MNMYPESVMLDHHHVHGVGYEKNAIVLLNLEIYKF